MNNVKVQAVAAMVQATKGTFFDVEFTKADGSLRKMNCRIGVKKHLAGGETMYDLKDQVDGDKTMGVWESNAAGGKESYRCFKSSKVVRIKACGNDVHFA